MLQCILTVSSQNVQSSKTLQKYLKLYIHNNYLAMTLKSNSHFIRLCLWLDYSKHLKCILHYAIKKQYSVYCFISGKITRWGCKHSF
jgi:hypothetical protein